MIDIFCALDTWNFKPMQETSIGEVCEKKKEATEHDWPQQVSYLNASITTALP